MNSTTAQSFACSFALHLLCGVALVAVLAKPLRDIVSTVTPSGIIDIVPGPEIVTVTAPGNKLVSPPMVRMPALPKYISEPIQQKAEIDPSPTSTPTPPTNVRSGPAKTTPRQYPQQHSNSDRRADSKSASMQKITVRTINVADFAFRGAEVPNNALLESGETSEVFGDDFTTRLLGELKRSYSSQQAIFAGLAAQVEFSIANDGSLRAVRLLGPSGLAEFDEAVLSALQRVRLSNFPITAIGQVFRVRFRVPNQ